MFEKYSVKLFRVFKNVAIYELVLSLAYFGVVFFSDFLLLSVGVFLGLIILMGSLDWGDLSELSMFLVSMFIIFFGTFAGL